MQVRVRSFYIATMQRCPYIHEMKERLLGAPVEGSERDLRAESPRERPQHLTTHAPQVDTQVGTIVKVSRSHLIH